MIQRMSIIRRRTLFVVLLVLGAVAPLLLLLPFLLIGPRALDSMPQWLSGSLIVVALLAPLLFLSYAGKAGAWSEFPGGGWTILLIWWLLGILLALTNWSYGLADPLLKAVTLGIVSPARDAIYPMPGLLRGVGASRSFTLGVPIYGVWLMVSYAIARDRRVKREREVERARMYEPWDDTGERVSLGAGEDTGEGSRTEQALQQPDAPDVGA